MARKPKAPAKVELEVSEQQQALEVELTDAQNQLSSLHTLNNDSALVNQLLGQAQMAEAFGQFSQTVLSSKLAYVKENKLYKAVAGTTLPDGSEARGTWAEFCSLLNMSVDKADLDIANLREFGEQALASMSRMGIGYREMRQFRRLPDDEKTALVEVAESGDKGAFLDLAEDLISKHAKEKEALTKELDEATANYEARGEVLANVQRENAELRTKAEIIKKLPPDERAAQLRQEAGALADQAEEQIRIQIRTAFTDVLEHGAKHENVLLEHDHADWLAHRLDLLDDALMYLRAELGIERRISEAGEPVWADPDWDKDHPEQPQEEQ